MRFDLEQFLTLTVALGTVGAIGVGVYTNRAAAEDNAAAATAEVEEDVEAELPSAESAPEGEPVSRKLPTEATIAVPRPTPIPELSDGAALDGAAGPQMEGMW